MKIFKNAFILLSVLLFSCKSENSLEHYFVSNEDNDDFVIIDVPVSMVKNAVNLSKEEKKAIESVKKLSVLYFKNDKKKNEEYLKQKQSLMYILKSDKYQTLSKFKTGNTKIDIKFIGTDDAIDEIVLFANDKNFGFLLARILGNKMNPNDMQLLLKNIQNMNFDLKQLKNLNLNL